MFGKLYLGELKKLTRPKALITISVICVVLFIVFAIIYNINLDELLENMTDIATRIEGEDEIVVGETDETNDTSGDFADYVFGATPDNIDEKIAYFNAKLKEYQALNKQKDSEGYYATDIYNTECTIAMLEYMKANNVYGKFNVEGYATYYSIKNAESFVLSYVELVTAILAIYGIAMAAGLYADEYSRGTIKLIMLRPVTKNQVTTAKLLALFTHLIAIFGIASLMGYVYGAIAYKSISLEKVYVVFNGSGVFASTVGGTVFYKMFFTVVKILSYATLSYAIGTILRKKTPAIVLALVVYLGIIAALFAFVGGERFIFSTNTDLSVYFGFAQTSFMNGGNFFIALPMLIVYLAVIIVSTYLVVDKRDVI